MNCEQAWSIVIEFTQSESLRRHMLAVETAMRPMRPALMGTLNCGVLLDYFMILIMNVTRM